MEGRSRRDRLEARLERAIRKGRADVAADLEAELYVPPFPAPLVHVWGAWCRLRRRKSAGAEGAQPLTWPDIDAFLRLSKVALSPQDIHLIENIDDAFLNALKAEASDAEQQAALRDGLGQASRQGISTAPLRSASPSQRRHGLH